MLELGCSSIFFFSKYISTQDAGSDNVGHYGVVEKVG